MKKYWLALALLASMPAFGEETPAREETIRELLEVTRAKTLAGAAYGQLDAYMDKVMLEAKGNAQLNAEQERLTAELRTKMTAMVHAMLDWEQLEPFYIQLYSETFSQSEIEGLLAFYKTDAGKALITKLPALTQNLTQRMLERMQELMPKVRAVAEEYAEKIKEAAKTEVRPKI
jgi:uncharacterized protein